MLVWRRHADSYIDFCGRRPDLVRSLRRALLITGAGIFRRHVCLFGKLSWPISKLCDGRVSEAERLDISRDFHSKRSCCIDFGAIRDLKVAGVTGAELFRAGKWHRFLRWRCSVVSQSVCDIEWKHGKNRTTKVSID